MQANLVERPAHVPPEVVVDFDIYNPSGSARDFHGSWKALQESGVPNLVWTPHNGGHWIATRQQTVREVFRDYQRFSSRAILVPKSHGELQRKVGIPSTIDPPEHRSYRTLFNECLNPKVVLALEPEIRALASQFIEGFRLNGGCNFVADYAAMLPIRLFMNMLALPPEDGPRIKVLNDAITRPNPDIPVAAAVQGMLDHIEPYIEARRGGNGVDAITRIVNGQIDGRPITKSEAMSMTTQLLVGGTETVVSMLGFVFLFLARNPGHCRELAANFSLIPAAVEEMLRRFPLSSNAREVTDDIVFEGVELKKGEMVVVATVLGGLDERANECPMTVDFRRTKIAHVSFGNGIHFCPGAPLARAELRISLEEWLKKIPEFELAPGADISFTAGIAGTVNALPLVWDVASTTA